MSKITSFFFSLTLVLILPLQTLAAETVVVGFISRESQNFYETVVKPYWQQLGAGNTVELVSLSPLNSKGEIDLEQLTRNIQNAPSSIGTIYVHWNEKYDPIHKNWLAALRKKTAEGTRVAFFAGMSTPGVRSIPLNQTLAFQVPKALILGELVEKERLSPLHFYGPELFSAFQSKIVSPIPGLAPLNFVSRWAQQSPHADLDNSLYELRKKKLKSLRMWPTTEDFFGRK
jgi:hypothetical protein